jgi:hypothetical protein
MEPQEIWGLIIKADEKLKYATDTTAGQRAEQAVALLQQALAEARAIDSEPLVTQAQTRLDDLVSDA